jgi:hypothetical protein
MPVPAAIEAIPFMTTLIATLEVAAERCRAAHLDGGHDAPLCLRHRRAIFLSIGFPIAAKHVRHFPRRPIFLFYGFLGVSRRYTVLFTPSNVPSACMESTL